MAAGPNVEELLKKLDDLHQAYLQTFQDVHGALSRIPSGSASASASAAPTAPATLSTSKRRRRSTLDIESERPADGKPITYHSSVLTGESDESDSDEEYYVQKPLPPYKFDHENLRHHLKRYKFNDHGKILLETVVDKGRLLDPTLFPDYDPDEKWHNSHYSVFDVGKDGAPLSRSEVVQKGTTKIDSAIWQAIQNLNSDPDSQLRAVGRITIVREPSPIILGALHLTMNQHFDMDELFDYLVQEDTSAAYLLGRNFSHDPRVQRSFAFKFDYFTIVGDDAQPMPWQQADQPEKLRNRLRDHIPISRCCSVVALSLSGEFVRRLRNATRKAKKQHLEHGFVYDPWAPWYVLNIQCYPDHKHSMDSHDSTKHYVNGPEAFLHTLLAEFKDAEKRFDDIYKKISKLVIPPADILFNGDLRDKLLFEDEEFTYSRRYFWGYQTLGIMKDSIKAIIDAYEDTFTDDVWEGKHKTLWPMIDEKSSRNAHWRHRMAKLKKEFEKTIEDLYKLYEENDKRRKEIRTLRDQLFSGTSVLESRKSVELSEVTILQGHNIKLLTLVSIFFLPLTFVTSVYGMTNMPQDNQDFKWFGVTMATVCIPFFLLIGSLNTTSGMEFWRKKWHQVLSWSIRPFSKSSKNGERYNHEAAMRNKKRSLSASEAIGKRNAQLEPGNEFSASATTVRTGRANSSSSNTQPQRASAIEVTPVSEAELASSTTPKKAMEPVTPVVSTEKATVQELETTSSWWEKFTGSRNRRGAEFEHNV